MAQPAPRPANTDLATLFIKRPLYGPILCVPRCMHCLFSRLRKVFLCARSPFLRAREVSRCARSLFPRGREVSLCAKSNFPRGRDVSLCAKFNFPRGAEKSFWANKQLLHKPHGRIGTWLYPDFEKGTLLSCCKVPFITNMAAGYRYMHYFVKKK